MIEFLSEKTWILHIYIVSMHFNVFYYSFINSEKIVDDQQKI